MPANHAALSQKDDCKNQFYRQICVFACLIRKVAVMASWTRGSCQALMSERSITSAPSKSSLKA